MHAIASAFCLAGYAAHALDIRGHGKSGIKGQIAYIGQLEDDLEDFMQAVNPAGPSTLIGFSSGGGFVLRFASCPRQDLFSSYVLLSPFLHHRAPTQKRNSGGWVSVGIPRIAALTILNRLGVTSFNSLPIIRFALPKEHETDLTPAYSFSLQQNFRPRDDYMADIRHVHQPMAVVTAQMTVTAKTREASFIAGQIL